MSSGQKSSIRYESNVRHLAVKQSSIRYESNVRHLAVKQSSSKNVNRTRIRRSFYHYFNIVALMKYLNKRARPVRIQSKQTKLVGQAGRIVNSLAVPFKLKLSRPKIGLGRYLPCLTQAGPRGRSGSNSNLTQSTVSRKTPFMTFLGWIQE